jgi:hypothetical protein
MFTHTKRLFQLSLITFFATFLLLGTAGVTTALAFDALSVVFNTKETCLNGSDKPIVRKSKSRAGIVIEPSPGNQISKNGGTTPFPSWNSVTFGIVKFGSLEFVSLEGVDGVALSKNLKKGIFQTFVNNENITLSASGVLVVDNDGNSKKIAGKFNGYDTINDCIYQGSFKGKRQKPLEPL